MAAATDTVTRHFALLMPNEPLCCPRGHHMHKKVWMLGGVDVAAFRCPNREAPSLGCDAHVLVIGFSRQMRVIVEVSSRELHEIEEHEMTIDRIRDHLGLSWKRRAA